MIFRPNKYTVQYIVGERVDSVHTDHYKPSSFFRDFADAVFTDTHVLGDGRQTAVDFAAKLLTAPTISTVCVKTEAGYLVHCWRECGEECGEVSGHDCMINQRRDLYSKVEDVVTCPSCIESHLRRYEVALRQVSES